MDVTLSVVAADALTIHVDVLIAKYAQQAYGLDSEIIRNIVSKEEADDMPSPGEHRIVRSIRNISAPLVLFVGVQPLREFGYPQIRDFAHRALTILRDERLAAAHVALTLQGAGFGLDETEAFESEVAGLVDALTTGTSPTGIQRITFVENDAARAQRLTAILTSLLPDGRLGSAQGRGLSDLPSPSQQTLRTAGYAAASKPHVFVAMPFSAEFEDLYHYGIQAAVKRNGYLCERADLSAFTGDVMAWVQSRISSAKLIVADLTGANPNVYLEVGFAWALRIPTVLVIDKAADLRFDVRGQRVIDYNGSIRSLEEKLGKELRSLQLAEHQPAD
jgi:hypothetical protein